MKTIVIPDIGTDDEVEVIEVAVSVGDTIAKEDTLITLESEKASMDVPSSNAGVVKNILVKLGDKVKQGTPILELEESEEGEGTEESEESEGSAPSSEQKETTTSTPETALTPATSTPATAAPREPETQPHEITSPRGVYASPAVRRLARELGVDLTQVGGTGRKGRVQKLDLQNFVKRGLSGAPAPSTTGAGLPAMPKVDFTKYGEIEVQPLSRIKKLSANNLHRNWVNIPHVTQFDEADITDLEAFRKSQKERAEAQGIRLTPLVFLMKAVVVALKEFPQFNSSLSVDGTELILKKYFHVGVAVDTPEGLVVPVIRDVDKKGLFELAKELGELSAKAREGTLPGREMQGSCFTISSLGGIGGTAFTPIVNAPDVAILGVSRSHMKPVYQNKEFVPRLMLPLCLSYDHRVIDGAEAARFITFMSALLADLRRMML